MMTRRTRGAERMSQGHFIALNHHRVMLRDSLRMQRFRDAVMQTVRPGDVVLDLGTGTGILAMWAAEAGARRIFAIDPAPIVRVAARMARDNPGHERIEFIEAASQDVCLPEPVDVLISECMGNFFVTDDLAPVLRDAARHLREGARVIPQDISLHVAPCFLPTLDDINFWDSPHYGLDLSAARAFALQQTYVRHIVPPMMVGAPTQLRRFALLDAPDDVGGALQWRLTAASTVHGFAGWFDARLSETVHLSTAPGNDTHWAQLIFPIEPVRVPEGGTIDIEFDLRFDGELGARWRWWGKTSAPDGESIGEFEHDTDLRFGARLAPA